MKILEDLRHEDIQDTGRGPGDYLQRVKDSESSYIILNYTQFAYLEQAVLREQIGVYQDPIPHIRVKGKIVLRMGKDEV